MHETDAWLPWCEPDSGVTREGDVYTVQTERPGQSYAVTVTESLEAVPLRALLTAAHVSVGHAALVIDATVDRLHGERIAAYLRGQGIKPFTIVTTVTEDSKTARTLERLAQQIITCKLGRDEPIIAVGGGALTDLAGMAAMTLKRGRPYVRIVTSGQTIDAGTSPKVMLNVSRTKSALGGFHLPAVAIVTTQFLRTVPDEQLRDMLAEIVKAAVMRDPLLFQLIEGWGRTLLTERCSGETEESAAATLEVFHRAVYATLADNGRNTWEMTRERRMLFGHIWGPSLEMYSLDTLEPLTHGAGVALDMALTVTIAAARGLLPEVERDDVLNVLESVGLPTWHTLMAVPGLLEEATAEAVRAEMPVPLPTEIGQKDGVAYVYDITREELEAAVSALRERTA